MLFRNIARDKEIRNQAGRDAPNQYKFEPICKTYIVTFLCQNKEIKKFKYILDEKF